MNKTVDLPRRHYSDRRSRLRAGWRQALSGKDLLACHGKDAKTPLKGMPYPKLAGQNAAYAEAQMKDIKSGARSNGQSAAMKGVMGLVNDEEIKALAEYLSKLK